jgi:hypothetical protein
MMEDDEISEKARATIQSLLYTFIDYLYINKQLQTEEWSNDSPYPSKELMSLVSDFMKDEENTINTFYLDMIDVHN